MKNRPLGAGLFLVDRQTDGHDEANSRYFVILRKRLESTNSFHFARFEDLREV
jgi:hypothetical protein